MIKFDNIKGGDLHIPQVGEFGIEMPPFFASYSKSKGWKLLNPITVIRNLAKRQHKLVMSLQRGDVKYPRAVTAEPMESPTFSQFKPADREKLLAWERDVKANPNKQASIAYPQGPIKERGRPVYLGKNGEHHGYDFNEDTDEYGINPKAPKPVKGPPKPRGRPPGPPKPPKPPKGPRGRPRKPKVVRTKAPKLVEAQPPANVKALVKVPNLKSVARPKEPAEDPAKAKYRADIAEYLDILNEGNRERRKGVKEFIKENAGIAKSLDLYEEFKQLRDRYNEIVRGEKGNGLIGRGPKKAKPKKISPAGTADLSSDEELYSEEEELLSEGEEAVVLTAEKIQEALKKAEELKQRILAIPLKKAPPDLKAVAKSLEEVAALEESSSGEEADSEESDDELEDVVPKKKRGRPKKVVEEETEEKRGRGRPKVGQDVSQFNEGKNAVNPKLVVRTETAKNGGLLEYDKNGREYVRQGYLNNWIYVPADLGRNLPAGTVATTHDLERWKIATSNMVKKRPDLPASYGGNGPEIVKKAKKETPPSEEEAPINDDWGPGKAYKHHRRFKHDLPPAVFPDEFEGVAELMEHKGKRYFVMNQKSPYWDMREVFNPENKHQMALWVDDDGKWVEGRQAKKGAEVSEFFDMRNLYKKNGFYTGKPVTVLYEPRRADHSHAISLPNGEISSYVSLEPGRISNNPLLKELYIEWRGNEEGWKKRKPTEADKTYWRNPAAAAAADNRPERIREEEKIMKGPRPHAKGLDLKKKGDRIGDMETFVCHMKRRKEPNYENSSTDGSDTDIEDDGGASGEEAETHIKHIKATGFNEGGALSVDELKGLLGASYDPKTTKVNDFHLDPSVSSKTTKVYHNSKTGQTVVAHMGTQGITDWGNNAVYALGGKWAYKKTDRYKEAKKVQDAAEKKYGSKNVSTIGHSQGGLQAELLGKNSKETITVNKATVPFQNKTNANQTDVRTQGDVVSALNPFQKRNKKEIEVKSSSYNPLTNHGTDSLSALDKDQMIGEGMDFEDTTLETFQHQLDKFREQHPDVNVHGLKDFAEKILADPGHYKDTTLRRAKDILNVVLKNKNHKGIYRMPHTLPHARGFGIDPRLMSPNPMFSRHPNAMANVFHSPHAMVSGLHGSGLSLQDVPGYGALRRLGDDVAHAGRHAEMVSAKRISGKGYGAAIGPSSIKPHGGALDMSGVRPIGPGSMKPRGKGLVKGSAEAKAFMASIRKKKMKGGALPPPSRSPITDPSLL